jgi:hypothetical protein
MAGKSHDDFRLSGIDENLVYARLARSGGAPGHKSLFASFSSEKEDSSFFERKEARKFLFPVLRHGVLLANETFTFAR